MTNAEIQVGEYVRTKKHGIFKVTELYEVEDKYYILNNDKDETYTIGGGSPRFDISKYIVNHSFNIIDLIEAGDFVNGWYVDDIADKFVISYDGVGETLMTEQDIKTIVTKEQFKAMEYKVGGEDD